MKRDDQFSYLLPIDLSVWQLHVIENPKYNFKDISPPMLEEGITVTLHDFKHDCQTSGKGNKISIIDCVKMDFPLIHFPSIMSFFTTLLFSSFPSFLFLSFPLRAFTSYVVSLSYPFLIFFFFVFPPSPFPFSLS